MNYTDAKKYVPIFIKLKFYFTKDFEIHDKENFEIL